MLGILKYHKPQISQCYYFVADIWHPSLESEEVMCSYKVWIKRGCPDSLVQSASSQELLLQTLYLEYIVLQSLARLNGMFYSHDEVGSIRWSLGQHVWHRPPLWWRECLQPILYAFFDLPTIFGTWKNCSNCLLAQDLCPQILKSRF